MKLYIPDLGERIRLVKPWTFDLHCESRNANLLKEIGQPYSHHYSQPTPGPWPYTVPDGTLLDVDRIYIRKGGDDFSSVTFVILADPSKSKGAFGTAGRRFWAKLEDVNDIEYEMLPEDQPWWFGVRDRLLAGEVLMVTPRIAALGKAVKGGAPIFLNPLVAGQFRADAKLLVMREGQKVYFIERPKDEAWISPHGHVNGHVVGAKPYSYAFPVDKVVGYVTILPA